MNKLVITALAMIAMGIARAAFADTDAELRAIEVTRRAAIKAQDFTALEKIYAPSFIAATGKGVMLDRATLFEALRHNDPSLSYEIDQVRIVNEGDTAVFFARLTGSAPDGKVAFTSRYSHVYVRRNGAWICIAAQSTPLPG